MLKEIPWPSGRWWMRFSSWKWGTPGDLSACVSAPEVLKVLACLRYPWDLVLLRPLLIVTWGQNTSVSAHHKKGSIDSGLSLSSWHLHYLIPKLGINGYAEMAGVFALRWLTCFKLDSLKAWLRRVDYFGEIFSNAHNWLTLIMFITLNAHKCLTIFRLLDI